MFKFRNNRRSNKNSSRSRAKRRLRTIETLECPSSWPAILAVHLAIRSLLRNRNRT